ncbi:MAG: acriflavine resistance protein B [Verrucomicrobia bacterium]|nr:MAG: acriflavine resistance protein B [Verrucomicrobiota bacterium]
MNISEPFIKRPIATSLLMVAIILVGVLGYQFLPVSALPTVDFPTIQVTSQYPGADPEVMMCLVTAPLEKQFGQISGLSSMSSLSSFGTSVITLQFALNKGIDQAAQDVQAAINDAGGVLPKGMPNPPVYSKVNPADTPILTLAITSDTLPLVKINDYADSILAQKLSEVSGVGLVTAQGNQKSAVRVRVNPAALTAQGISLETVRNVIDQANVNAPKGSFNGTHQSFTIGTNDQIRSASELAPIIVAYRNGAAIRLQDVASIEDGVENSLVGAWVADHHRSYQPAVLLDIQRQPGANVVATVDRIKALLPQLTRSLPAGVHISVFSDRTETTRASVRDVQFTLLLTVFLVILVLFLFLRKLSATVIPSLALSVSVIGTFACMYLLGFSLDNLSLMALTISTGFVVDDAIVMIENIVRYVEQGESALSAALKGARQIGFTIISLTISLIAVFIPLLFMSGIVGRLFREFAVTLSCAVIVSAVVSLTLTPMMCAKMLNMAQGKENNKELGKGLGAIIKREWLKKEHFLTGFVLDLYERSLGRVLRHQRTVLFIALITLIATGFLFMWIPKGLLPLQDTGLIIGVTEAAQDISFRKMVALQKQLSDVLSRDPDVLRIAAFTGAGTMNPTQNSGRLYIVLKPREHRANVRKIMSRLSESARQIIGISLYLQAAQDLQIDTHVSRTQFQYILEDVDSEILQKWASRLLNALKAEPGLADVALDQQTHGLQLDILIDRITASRLNVPIQAIDDTLYDAFGQRQISVIYTELNQYRIVMENESAFRNSPQALDRLYVPSTTGKLVPLNALATTRINLVPLSISHQGQFPSATLSFNLRPGHSLGEAVHSIERVRREIGMPERVKTQFVGSVAEFRSSLRTEVVLIIAAIIVIYIVLGVLYESYIHPITILSTLPSAGVGALLALLVCKLEFSLVALIGLILLIGIVKKNAIMMIDFALDMRRTTSVSAYDAICQACLLRFRPIIMTTAAALLGALPLALESGTGSELRRPLGVLIIGGLLLSQLITLYTTPVIYLQFDQLEEWFKRRRNDIKKRDIISVST